MSDEQPQDLLSPFSKEDRRLLVSLPYRVGLWVSFSDDSGGEESEAAERATLEGLIVGYSQDFLKSEFVEAIMSEALAQRTDWDGWANNLDDTTADCRKAVNILMGALSDKEVHSYAESLMDIGIAVANAFMEEAGNVNGQSFIDRMQSIMTTLFKGTGSVAAEYSNISRKEMAALEALAEALDLDFDARTSERSHTT